MIDQLANNPWVFWITWVAVMGGSAAVVLTVMVRSGRKSRDEEHGDE